jgi:hypothetical protein
MGREHIPYLDIKGFQGIYTKSTPEVLQAEQLSVAQNCDFFEEYGAIAKMRGSSRILNEPYTEQGVVQKIPWVEHYKSADLDGTILRQTMCAAGTVLGRVENGAILPLLTNRTANMVYDSTFIDRFMFLTNYNPDLVGVGDDNVKYDGAVFTQWGVSPPGTVVTVVDDFDSAAAWTPYRCDLSDQLSTTTGHITWDGESVRIDAAGQSGPPIGSTTFYTSDAFSLERAHPGDGFYAQGDSRENEDAIRNRVSFFTYFPRGSLTRSLTFPTNHGFQVAGPVLSVYVSPDASTTANNNWQFDFTNGVIREGWNKINLDFASGEPGGNQPNSPVGQQTGFFYPEDQTIRRTRFEFYLQTDQTVTSGLRIDKYQKTDEGALVASPSGEGDITGRYLYKVVYVSKYGQLSNAGPSSVSITAASHGQIDLTRIPVSPDTQVTARRIYRTVGNGSVWLFLDEILDNVTTTYIDVVADGSLSNETAPQAGDYSDDNSVPPKCGIVYAWKKTIFMGGDPQNPYTLYYSEDAEFESFPLINALDMDGKITGIYETYAGLVIETETGKWQLIGDNPDFSFDKIVHGMGCVGRRACGTARLIGYAVDRDGLRLFDLSETSKISEPIRDKYDTEIDKVNIELIHTVHSKAKNMILQFNPDADGDYTSIFQYQYPIDSVGAGYWSQIVTPDAANLNFLDACEIEDANGDFQILAGGADGMIYRLFNDNSKNWVDAAGVEYAIDSKIRTHYIRAGGLGSEVMQATGRMAPHTVELRIGDDDACTWIATVETAKGIKQTRATSSSELSMEFGLNNSLIRQRVPSASSTPGEYVRLTFQNNQADVYTKILAARFYFKTQPGNFLETDVDNTIV